MPPLPLRTQVASSWDDDFRYSPHGSQGRVVSIEIGVDQVRAIGLQIASRLSVRFPQYQGGSYYEQSALCLRSLEPEGMTLSVCDPAGLIRGGSAIEILSITNPTPAPTRVELIAEAYARRRVNFLKGPQ